MPGETKNGMQCAEFDALLIEALDATLTGPKLESFQAHARVCAVCGPLFAEADAGRRWLKSLAEVEPPANLVHNILLATTGYESKRVAVRRQGEGFVDGRGHGVAAAGVRSSAFHEPPAPLRHVIRNGVLLSVNFAQPGGGEGERCAACGPAAQRDQAHLLRDHRPGGQVLRKYSLRVRNRIAGAGIQTSDRSRRNRPPRSKTKKRKTTTPVDNPNRDRNATTARERTSPCWPRSRMIRL